MRRVVVTNSITLDGVMQAPGRPDEDRRDGFAHGGWALPYNDAVMGATMGARIATGGALLFGRRTYEDFFAVWPNRPEPNPFTEVLNNFQKYVASRSAGQAPALARIRRYSRETPARPSARSSSSRAPTSVCWVVASLGVRTLMRHDLVDESTFS